MTCEGVGASKREGSFLFHDVNEVAREQVIWSMMSKIDDIEEFGHLLESMMSKTKSSVWRLLQIRLGCKMIGPTQPNPAQLDYIYIYILNGPAKYQTDYFGPAQVIGLNPGRVQA